MIVWPWSFRVLLGVLMAAFGFVFADSFDDVSSVWKMVFTLLLSIIGFLIVMVYRNMMERMGKVERAVNGIGAMVDASISLAIRHHPDDAEMIMESVRKAKAAAGGD